MHKLQNTDNRIFQDFNFDNRSLLVKTMLIIRKTMVKHALVKPIWHCFTSSSDKMRNYLDLTKDFDCFIEISILLNQNCRIM